MKNKRSRLPHWIQPRVLPKITDEDPWYVDETCVWRFRAIHHTAGLDYVPDRGGFVKDRMTDENKAFVLAVLNSKEFSDWVEQQSGSSSEVFCADGNNYHLRATNNSSYGYTYLWAWWKEA
jgi:hypothetical protein